MPHFKSDRQRKAVMAKLTATSKVDIAPKIVSRNPDGLGKSIKEKIREFKAKRAIAAEKARLSRIKTELQAQKAEAKQARELESELAVEKSREAIRIRKEKAQAELRKIDIARREKTIAGKILKAERAAARKGIELARVGLKKLAEQQRKPRKIKKVRPEKGISFFGIR